MRLDKYLYDSKLVESRTIAQNLIKQECVKVNDKIVTSTSFDVKENDIVELLQQSHYVSRAAYKLLKAIEEFKIDFSNKVVLDIGSSTGGFVQVALENNASFVYANDVGSNQLHHSLKNNPKIKSIENKNFKDIQKSDFDKHIDLITCDVSFISSKIILEKIKTLFNDIQIVVLLKPQFEFGKELTKKHKGFVPEQYHDKIIFEYNQFLKQEGFKILGFCESPILGQKLGNKEYLYYLGYSNEK